MLTSIYDQDRIYFPEDPELRVLGSASNSPNGGTMAGGQPSFASGGASGITALT